MKRALLFALFGAGAYFLAKREFATHANSKDLQETVPVPPPAGPDLTVILNQDVSGSRLEFGVELISSHQLSPYYYETNRNITLAFSLINDTSIGHPLQVFLKRRNFVKPEISDYTDDSGKYTRDGKLQFSAALKKYLADSVAFFRKRDDDFKTFSSGVDSMVSLYRDQADPTTDIGTCFETDRKLLQADPAPGSKKVVIVLSDGKDNRNKWMKIQRLPAKVILVNSGPAIETPIDKLVDLRLATLDNAIQYSLKQ